MSQDISVIPDWVRHEVSQRRATVRVRYLAAGAVVIAVGFLLQLIDNLTILPP